MADRSREPWRESVARVLDQHGYPCGAAFLISDRHLCTCAHVVADALGLPGDHRPRPRKSVRIDWLDDRLPARSVKVAAWRPKGPVPRAISDIAILELDRAVPDARPALLSATGSLRDRRFTAVGFPSHRPAGTSAKGRLRMTDANGMVEAVGEEDLGEPIQRGFSGTPAWDSETGAVLGFFTDVETRQGRRVALMLPVSGIGAAWPALVVATPPEVAAAPETARPAKPSFWRRLLLAHAPRLEYALVRIGLFEAPADRPELAEWLREFAAEMRHHNRFYLPLAAASVDDASLPQARGLDGDVPQPIIKTARRAIRLVLDASSGGDRATAQLAALSRRSRVIRDVPRRLGRTEEPLILLGDPGTGKSMTLREVAAGFADRELRRSLPIIPVFVRLSGFKAQAKPGLDDVAALVKSKLPAGLRARYGGLVRDGRLAVFFDGMDELPRLHYNEAAEILSRFAEVNRGRIRCLFTCRINDFSPEFSHRQLVLLPFEERQIRDFVAKSLPTQIEIEGETLSRAEVVGRLYCDPNAEQFRNPNLLYLLCQYLMNDRRWPASRAELMKSYFEHQVGAYRNRRREAGGRPVEKEALLDMLGRLAFQVILAKAGADIDAETADMGTASPERRAEALRAARTCGFLADSEERLGQIRFDHHRYQEYFAAHHIASNRLEIDWLAVADDPGWQEVLINLVASRSGSHAFEALLSLAEAEIDAVTEEKVRLTREMQSSEVRHPRDAAWALREMRAADRLELLARAVREARGGDSDVAGRGIPFLQDEAEWLSQIGTPPTQVKMLWVAQSVPEIELETVLKTPRQSPVSWVREQALQTEMALTPDRRARSGPFADRVAIDLAQGSLLRRSAFYARISSKEGGKGVWATLALGWAAIALAALANAALGAVAVMALSRAGWVEPGSIALIGGAVGAVLCFWQLHVDRGALIGQALLWPFCCAIAIDHLVASVAGGTVDPGYVLAILLALVAAIVLSSAAAALIEAALLLIFAVAARGRRWLRTFTPAIAAYAVPRDPDRTAGRNPIAWLIGGALLLLVAGAYWLGRDWLNWGRAFLIAMAGISLHFTVRTLWRKVTRWRDPYSFGLPEEEAQWIDVAIGAVASLIPLCGLVLGSSARSSVGDIVVLVLFGLLLALGVIRLVSWRKASAVLDGAERSYWERVAGQGAWEKKRKQDKALLISRTAAIAVLVFLAVTFGLKWVAAGFAGIVALMILIGFGNWTFKRVRDRVRVGRLARGDRRYSEGEWFNAFYAADPEGQRRMLQITTHHSLGITPEAYHELIVDMQLYAGKEPVASAYWDARNRLEQILRQADSRP